MGEAYMQGASYPKLMHIHTHIPMAHVFGSKLGFSILNKDTSTFKMEEPEVEVPIFGIEDVLYLDQPLSHNCNSE